MKKRLLLMSVAVLALCLSLSACTPKTTLAGEMDPDGKSYSITADDTDEGDMVTTGTLIIGKGEKLVVTSALEGGSAINVYLINTESMNLDKDSDAEDIVSAADSEDAAFALPVSGASGSDHFISPGEYYVKIVAGDGMSGTTNLSVKPFDDFESWTKTDTPEEAAEGAGFATFHGGVNSYTRSGITDDEAYYYQDGKVIGVLSLGNFTVYSIKSEEALGDPEADAKQYKNSFTKDINGVPMTMYGKDDDTISKAAWQKGQYYYNVIAYKKGDDDFGMSLAETSTISASVD